MFKAGFWFCAAIFAVSLYLLFTGSPLLLLLAIERIGLPLGNVTTWVGMIALVMMVYLGSDRLRHPRSKPDAIYRATWIVLLVLALGWPLVSYALAGNWANTFSGSATSFRGSPAAAKWFMGYSIAVVILPLVFVVVRWLHLRNQS